MFGSYNFHIVPMVTPPQIAGIVLGWMLVGGIMAFGLTLIVIDIVHRGKEMDNKLADAKLKMIDLGINIDVVDREY